MPKLNVLSGLDPVKLCTGYELDGKKLDYMPELSHDVARCKPIYVDIPGWHEDISNIEDFTDLPENASHYVQKLEDLMGVKMKYISVGPGRKQTFMK